MTRAEREERKRLIREGERRNAIISLYEARPQMLAAKLQEIADDNQWENKDALS